MAPEEKPSRRPVGRTRREALQGAGILGAAAMLSGALNVGPAWSDVLAKATAVKAAGTSYKDIDHFVFLMMENRSYDHYFGAYHKGRGFDDHPKKSLGVFEQDYPTKAAGKNVGGNKVVPKNKLLPFHLDSSKGFACTDDLTHDFGPMHDCWNNGKMDAWVKTHTAIEGERGTTTMGYYTRDDIPFYWALADHYTLLDNYHSSIIGPTHPNRMMQMTGTVDPAGTHGGPILATLSAEDDNAAYTDWDCTWETMPEVLQNAHVSWKMYTPDGGPTATTLPAGKPWSQLSGQAFGTWEHDQFVPSSAPDLLPLGDNILPYFTNFQNPKSPLWDLAYNQTFPGTFYDDVRAGTLPSVSWIIPPLGFDEHPAASSRNGEFFTKLVLDALTSNEKVWSKTALFLMYDENDGWFDHVKPPVAPKGTKGEWVTAKNITSSDNETHTVDDVKYSDPIDTWNLQHKKYEGPLGLGMRVPALMISPFSAGGHVVSGTFDHTSQLRLISKRFGVKLPNVSKWRQKTVGDLTDCFQAKPTTKVPSMPGGTTVYLPDRGSVRPRCRRAITTGPPRSVRTALRSASSRASSGCPIRGAAPSRSASTASSPPRKPRCPTTSTSRSAARAQQPRSQPTTRSSRT
jgi:phospholipase C